jgi:hypothetical protein
MPSIPRASLSTGVACLLVAACGSSPGTSASTDGGKSGEDARRDVASPTDGGGRSDAKHPVDGALADGSRGDRDTGSQETAKDASTADRSAAADAGSDAAEDVTTRDAGAALIVDLGTASQFVILAETGISTVSPSVITGDLGLSPAAATYVTGFSPTLGASGAFSTSSQVTGKIYAADYASPTPTMLTTAIGDMGAAFTAAAGRAPDVTGLGAGSIGGKTLPAGVYRWGTGLLMATDVTLAGSATDVWIFQIAKNLTVSDGAHLVLSGGALPENVFWQVSGNVSLGTTVQFDGTILSQTGITLNTGASITGRLLAQTAVTLDANTIVASP